MVYENKYPREDVREFVIIEKISYIYTTFYKDDSYNIFIYTVDNHAKQWMYDSKLKGDEVLNDLLDKLNAIRL